MALIPWVRAADALVGSGHPVKSDTLNAPLRALLTAWGYNPDASSLPSPSLAAITSAATDATTKANAAQAAAIAAAATDATTKANTAQSAATSAAATDATTKANAAQAAAIAAAATDATTKANAAQSAATSAAATDATTKANAAQATAVAYVDDARPQGLGRTFATLKAFFLRAPRYNPRDYTETVINTGANDARAAFALAVTDAASTNATVKPSAGTYLLNSDITLTNYSPSPGAVLKPAAGVRVTINGVLKAARTALFDLSLGGTVAFSAGAVPTLYPEWWGAKGDGVNNDTVPTQYALNAVQAAGAGVVRFTGGNNYVLTSALTLDPSAATAGNITLWGYGATFTCSSATYVYEFTASSVLYTSGRLYVLGGRFLGTSATQSVFRNNDVPGSTFRDLKLTGFTNAILWHWRNVNAFSEQNNVLDCSVRDFLHIMQFDPASVTGGAGTSSFARTNVRNIKAGNGTSGSAWFYLNGGVYDSEFDGIAGNVNALNLTIFECYGVHGGTNITGLKVEGTSTYYGFHFDSTCTSAPAVFMYDLRGGSAAPFTPTTDYSKEAKLRLYPGLSILALSTRVRTAPETYTIDSDLQAGTFLVHATLGAGDEVVNLPPLSKTFIGQVYSIKTFQSNLAASKCTIVPDGAVLLTATANAGAVSLTCNPLTQAVASGTVLSFGGLTATTTANAAAGDTSIAVSALAAQINSGMAAFVGDSIEGNISSLELYYAQEVMVIKRTGNATSWSIIGSYNVGRQIIDGWYTENLAANVTAQVMSRLATTSDNASAWIAAAPGYITGLALHSNAARTAGSVTATVYINGVATTFTAVINTNGTTFTPNYLPWGSLKYARGDLIDIRLTSGSLWAPTTADFRASLITMS